jgi:hypothetical protein
MIVAFRQYLKLYVLMLLKCSLHRNCENWRNERILKKIMEIDPIIWNGTSCRIHKYASCYHCKLLFMRSLCDVHEINT